MRLATVAQAQEIDDLSQKVYGLSAEILMESAGVMSARELQQNFYPELTRGMTGIVCGPGNNGADGLVVARHLHSMGFRDVCIFLSAPKQKRSVLFKEQLRRAELHGLRIVDGHKDKNKMGLLSSCELIVDALFGIGFRGAMKSEFLAVVNQINSLKIPVASLDCPSGLNCDSGKISSVAVRAHTTFTFGLPKPGFFVGDGPQYVGKLRVLSIGFPYECLRGIATTHFVFNDRLARRYLPNRKDQTHKGDFGKLGVIAGSPGMWGAGVLACQAAYRIGAGYVVWAAKEMPIQTLEQTPEVLTTTVDDEKIWKVSDFTAYAVGPGLAQDQQTLNILKKLISLKPKRVVVDADAIIVASKNGLLPFPKTWVVTPHPGELAKVLKCEVSEIEADRFLAASKAAEKFGCHVLLKGYRSILAYRKRVMIINAGNSALAKAGSGDVLTGMIGGLLAQGLDTIQATATAAYLHGRLADEWSRSGRDKRSLNPNDLKDSIAQLLTRVSQGAIF